MNVTGRLRNPEFLGSSLPLTAMIRGEKVIIGQAIIDYNGRVDATVNNAEVQDVLNEGFAGRLSIRLCPEVRLEKEPLGLENIILSSDLVE